MKKLLISITMSLVVFLLGATAVSASNYEIIKGDNLWTIATNNNMSMQHLMKINNLNSSLIHPGRVLTLASSSANQSKPVNKPSASSKTYKVKKGDTLSKIGSQYNISVSQLKQRNNLKSSLILIGQVLTLNGQSQAISKPTVKPTVSKPNVQKPVKQPVKQVVKKPVQAPKGKTINVKATAYTAECAGCSGITYTGINLNKDRNAKVIAVDPTVIPLGTKVYVQGYGQAIAGDIGSAIKGNRIDIHLPTKKQAFSWGVRNVKVTIIQ